jgi:hypothetical protein
MKLKNRCIIDLPKSHKILDEDEAKKYDALLNYQRAIKL